MEWKKFLPRYADRKLDPAQEKALRDWIDYNDQNGKSVKRAQILATAISILQQSNPSESPHIGEKWLKRWLERHPEYRTRRRKSLDIERLLAQDKNVIQEWFSRYQAAIDQYGIQPEDL